MAPAPTFLPGDEDPMSTVPRVGRVTGSVAWRSDRRPWEFVGQVLD